MWVRRRGQKKKDYGWCAQFDYWKDIRISRGMLRFHCFKQIRSSVLWSASVFGLLTSSRAPRRSPPPDECTLIVPLEGAPPQTFLAATRTRLLNYLLNLPKRVLLRCIYDIRATSGGEGRFSHLLFFLDSWFVAPEGIDEIRSGICSVSMSHI